MSVKTSINALKKMNEKMYPKLSPDERFKMVINTFINNDKVRREKLVKSCPMVNYSVSDPAYTDRIDASRDIVTVFIIQLLEYDKIVSILKILNGFNYQEREVQLEKKLISEIQAFLLAFETFCRVHLEVEVKDIIQAWYGYDERYIRKVEKMKELINTFQIDHDNELREIWLEKVFLYHWRTRINT